MKEGEPQKLPYLELTLGLLALSSLFAFSRKTRQQIYNRDRGKSRWSDEPGEEAAHILHNRDNPLYDDPSNGRMLTKREHYLDHLNREGRNGLPPEGNRAALRLIWKRLSEEERKGLPEPDDNS